MFPGITNEEIQAAIRKLQATTAEHTKLMVRWKLALEEHGWVDIEADRDHDILFGRAFPQIEGQRAVVDLILEPRTGRQDIMALISYEDGRGRIESANQVGGRLIRVSELAELFAVKEGGA